MSNTLEIIKTKEYYEEFQKIFNKLKSDRKKHSRRHYPIDDFKNADRAYSYLEDILNKNSSLTKSYREFILIIHNSAIIQCITKYNETNGINSTTEERS